MKKNILFPYFPFLLIALAHKNASSCKQDTYYWESIGTSLYLLYISVSPSRRGSMTRSTRSSWATKSLNSSIPCVWRSLS